MSAPRYAESIPARNRPEKLPRLVPGRASYVAGVVTGGALIVLCLALLALAVTL